MKVWDWKFKQNYLLIGDDNVVVTFANQKLKFDVSKIESFVFQVDWLVYMSLPKTFRATVPAFYPQILVSKLIYFQKFAHAWK